MMEKYKILIIGLGSIGHRHVKNIAKYIEMNGKVGEIDAFRSGKSDVSEADSTEYINRVYYDIEKLPDDYDAIFITNPTDMHYATLNAVIEKGRYFFIEKPVFAIQDLDKPILFTSGNDRTYVACPLRYSEVIKYIKEYVTKEKVIHARAICSTYLPDWRPKVDYRKTYSAHSKRGGGVSIDLIHEWDYLHYLFGMPVDVKSITGKVSNLDIDSDDIALYIAKYTDMTLELHLNYFGRDHIRKIEVYANNEVITGDIIAGSVVSQPSGKSIEFHQNVNSIYEREIENFFEIVEGRIASSNTIKSAIDIMHISMEGR